MRACEPTVADLLEGGGVKVFHEVFGDGEPTIMLMSTWPVVVGAYDRCPSGWRSSPGPPW
jgi:hypothetical protein